MFLNALSHAQKPSFSLDISLDKSVPGYVYLAYEDKLDSSKVINNHLLFGGFMEKGVSSALIFSKEIKYFHLGKTLYLENTKIFIVADVTKKKVRQNDTLTTLEVKSVKGSRTTDINDSYNDFSEIHKNDSNFRQLLYDKVEEIAASNPKNPIAGDLLYQLLFSQNYDKDQLRKIYFKINPGFQDNFALRKLQHYLFEENFVQTNGTIFNFALPDVNNVLVNTATVKGKWILLDFWASWCAGCLEQFPELKKIYEKFRGENFEIVAVSIDKERASWVKALAKESLPWINIIETHGESGPVARKYKLFGVPQNYLIDPQGKIVADNIDLKLLEKVLNGRD